MATTVYRQLQLRRDTLANLPLLAEGELFMVTDTSPVQLWLGTANGNVRIF